MKWLSGFCSNHPEYNTPGIGVHEAWTISGSEEENSLHIKKSQEGTSRVVQWLRLCASIAGGTGSIPGRGTKIPHGPRCGQKKKKKKKSHIYLFRICHIFIHFISYIFENSCSLSNVLHFRNIIFLMSCFNSDTWIFSAKPFR